MFRTIWGLVLAAAILVAFVWWFALYSEKGERKSWFGHGGGQAAAVA